jgi:nitrate/nitrite-specific signal transduction histidine kinase
MSTPNETETTARMSSRQRRLAEQSARIEIVRQSQRHRRTFHARATFVWVSLRRPSENALEVEIRDDGIGFEPDQMTSSKPRTYGMSSMRERAEVLGGSLLIESAPGSGTRVVVSVPLSPRPLDRKEARRAAEATFGMARGWVRPQPEDR